MLRLVFSFDSSFDSDFIERKELCVIGCSTLGDGLNVVKDYYPDCHRVNVTIYSPDGRNMGKLEKAG